MRRRLAFSVAVVVVIVGAFLGPAHAEPDGRGDGPPAGRRVEPADLAAPSVTAYYGTGGFRINHWNMCGNACPLDPDTSVTHAQAPNTVLYITGASNPRPLAIGLNEVCFTALQPIVNQMAGFGYYYSSLTRITTNVSATPACGYYGNVIFHVGNYLSRTPIDLEPDHPDDFDDRKALCVRFDAYAKVTMCSGHATHKGDASWATPQVGDYIAGVNAAYTGKCRWITGDFNLEPSYTGGGPWRTPYDASYEEVDEPSPWQYTHEDPDTGYRSKIDYIWISEAQHTQTYSMITSQSLYPVSDHLYLTGTFNFSGTCP